MNFIAYLGKRYDFSEDNMLSSAEPLNIHEDEDVKF